MSAPALDERDLSEAIAAHAFEIYFQPQIEIRTGEVVAVEGLSRLRHRLRGTVSPAEFIPLAEATGAIHDLGRLALDECCRSAKAWADRGIRLEVAVNVSPLQLATTTFFDQLERELVETGVSASDLILEVTESEEIDDHSVLAARLDIVQEWGVTVSIDDVGAGYSSIERATALHARELKLDRSLVAREDWDSARDAVRLARERGMRVVAEGVETERQLRFAQQIGCDRAQGYYIARPAPRERFEAWMRDKGFAGGAG